MYIQMPEKEKLDIAIGNTVILTCVAKGNIFQSIQRVDFANHNQNNSITV